MPDPQIDEHSPDFQAGYRAGIAAGRAGAILEPDQDSGDLWTKLVGGLCPEGDPVGEYIHAVLSSPMTVQFLRNHTVAEYLQALGGLILTSAPLTDIPPDVVRRFLQDMAGCVDDAYDQMRAQDGGDGHG